MERNKYKLYAIIHSLQILWFHTVVLLQTKVHCICLTVCPFVYLINPLFRIVYSPLANKMLDAQQTYTFWYSSSSP